jgi:hypothetical protein
MIVTTGNAIAIARKMKIGIYPLGMAINISWFRMVQE